MNKQTITSLIIIIVFVYGLVWWSRSADNRPVQKSVVTDSTSVSSGKLLAEEKLFDFGAISMQDGNVQKVFTVANSGGGEVNLVNISTSCMCTTAYLLRPDGSKIGPFGMPGHGGGAGIVRNSDGRMGEIIPAGESREIEVVYDPNAHGPAGVGMIDRSVYLKDANGQVLELRVKARVTP